MLAGFRLLNSARRNAPGGSSHARTPDPRHGRCQAPPQRIPGSRQSTYGPYSPSPKRVPSPSLRRTSDLCQPLTRVGPVLYEVSNVPGGKRRPSIKFPALSDPWQKRRFPKTTSPEAGPLDARRSSFPSRPCCTSGRPCSRTARTRRPTGNPDAHGTAGCCV